MKKFHIARAARSPIPTPRLRGRTSAGEQPSEQPSQPAQVAKMEIPLGRRRARVAQRFLLIGGVLITFAMSLYLLPLGSQPSKLLTDYGAQILQTIPQDAKGLKQIPTSGIFSVNWLVSIRYTVSLVNDEEGRYISMYPNQVDDFVNHLRWSLTPHFEAERFAVIATIALVIIGSVAFFFANSSKKWDFEIPEVGGSLDSALRVEMKNAWISAQRFYSGSLYLLMVGVVMAFVGMGAFFSALPDFSTFAALEKASPTHWESYAVASIRPFGLLVFIEAIAWFFLRQYRSSTEDFKAFHRIYLRRSNYFAARKAYAELETTEKSQLMAAALLSEDLSGRLTKGQSTESIEAMKIDDNNPIFNILNGAMGRLRDGKGHDEKSSAKMKDDKSKET